MPEQPRTLRVAILGAGTVGSQVIRLIQEQRADLSERCGAKLDISAVVVRNPAAPRDVHIAPALLTTDAHAAIDDADIVIELIGGIDPAREYVLRALNRGATVVTGNKALLAAHGPELYEAAAQADTDLYFEAAVAGAVPVVYGLRESLAGDRISRIVGIVNGTTNFILDSMLTAHVTYEQALADAQERGYAEADPTADVEGLDAAAKCALLASLAFHSRVSINDVSVEGISGISADDMKEAARTHHVIKLLAIAERCTDDHGNEVINARVHPALVPTGHPLATVDGVYNAILIEGESAGRLMFYGQGAGGTPTASAVLSDLVAGASHRVHGGHAPRESTYAHLPIIEQGMTRTRFQLRVHVHDDLGVLADVASVFARHGVSIHSVDQREGEPGSQTTIMIATHCAREADVVAVAEALRQSDAVIDVASLLRMEGE